MAKKKSKALAKKEDTTPQKYSEMLADYSPEELEQMGEVTGTEDIPEEDRRPPLYVWNLETVDESGNEITKDKFYNTQTGEQFDEVVCSFLGLKRTRECSYQDEETGQKVITCRSLDRKIGIDENGNMKNCENCPERFGKPGKRKNCTIVMRFIGWDFERNEFFVLNCKRTSYVPMNSFLEKNFLNQLKLPGQMKRRDIPLYMIKCRLTLKREAKKGQNIYYVIQPEVVEPNDKDTVMGLMKMASEVKKMTTKELVQDEGEAIRSGGGGVEGEVLDDDDDVPF